MYDSHHTRGGDEKRGVFGLASKPVAMVWQWFGPKITATVSWFGPQNRWRWFGSGLAPKPLRQFLGLGLKTKVNGLVIWDSKSL
jgi:hypothetical protein